MSAPSQVTNPESAGDGVHSESAREISDAFLLVLRRPVQSIELRDQLRGYQPGDLNGLAIRLLSSPEFGLLYGALREERETGRDPGAEERALNALGSNEAFVDAAYRLLLGRPADAGGLGHYAAALASGDTRASILRSLVLSGEFGQRFDRLNPVCKIPYDVQLCELANPAKWDNPEWMALLTSIGHPEGKPSMHRKAYEFGQLAYGLKRLGFLHDATRIVSVGAGHEPVLYWLANHVGRVVATDMYAGVWQDVQSREGDAGVIASPRDYAPYPYREDRLVFMKMDGLRLGFTTGSFDVAYSLSSIEHFGGLAGAVAAMDEMARVLRPGGILALATEFVIAGPRHDETFQPAEFAELISRPGLELVSPFDADVYRRYDYSVVDLYANPYQAPHMVVRFNDTVFTSAFVFLRKR